MDRQLEIRQALNTFLVSPTPPEPVREAVQASPVDAIHDTRADALQFAATDAQRAVLADLQHSLQKHGIAAGSDEIGRGLMEALAARPSLCRGLLAAYLLDL